MQTAIHFATAESVEKASLIRKESVRAELAAALKRNAPSRRNVTELVIETPHPYQDNMDLVYEAIIPGATELTLEFDPLCATETNCDWLQLYLRANKEMPLRDRLTGGVGSWPTKDPIKIQGDRAFFHFHSDGSRTDWGFKCLVTAVLPKAAPVAGAAAAEAETEALTVSAMVRTVVALLRSQSRADPALQDVVLDIFADLLRRVKAGSMSTVSPLVSASLSEFQGYLISLLEVPNSPDKWAAIVQMMLNLTIARGSQLDIVRLLPQLLSSPAKSLPVLGMMRAWAATAKAISSELCTHAPADGAAVSVDLDWGAAKKADIRYISSDGTFLYVVTEHERLKVGTGLNLTEAGFIYDVIAHQPGSATSSPYVMLALDGVAPLLGVNPDASAGSALAWLDRETLQVTRVIPGALESSRAPPFSDGVFLYVLNFVSSDAAASENDSGSSERVELIEMRPLPDNDDWVASPAAKYTWPRHSWLTDLGCCPYTNGREIVFVCGTTYRRVDKATGAVLSELTREVSDNSPGYNAFAHAYDMVNNITWCTVANKLGSILAYPNPGYARPHNPTARDTLGIAASEALAVLSSLPADANDLPKEALGPVIFALMDNYVGMRALPRFPTNAEKARFRYQEPFVWELQPNTFPVLFDLILRYTNFALAAPSMGIIYQLIVCVHMLHANLQQLALFDASARLYGMTDELAGTYLAKFYELIELSVPGVDSMPAETASAVRASLAALRDAVCYTIAADYTVLVPTAKKRVSLLSELVANSAGLSAGKRQLLTALLRYALFSLVESFGSVDQAKETGQLLSAILDEAALQAKHAANNLPKSLDGLSVQALRSLESADTPSALVMFLREAQAVIRASEDEALLPLKKSYARSMLERASSVIGAFANAKPTGWDAASSEIRDAYRDLLVSVFKRSYGTIIPGTLVDLHEAISARSVAEEFQDVLLSSAAGLEAVVGRFPYAKREAEQMEVVETAHPYENNTDWTRELTLGNATTLVIKFDPQNRTERNCDWIEFTDTNGVAFRYSGPDGWPNAPVEIAGPRVRVQFHSDGSNVDWGVKATITSLSSLPWIVGVQNILSSLAVRSSSQLLAPPVLSSDDLKDPHRLWLSDPLFENGRLHELDVAPDIAALLADAAAGGPQTASLVNYFCGLTKADHSVFVEAKPLALAVRKAIGHAFVVELHHTRSASDALALLAPPKSAAGAGGLSVSINAPTVTPTLLSAWRQAVDVGVWLRAQIDELFKAVPLPDGANVNALIDGRVDPDGPRIPDGVMAAAQAAAADAGKVCAALTERALCLAGFSPAIEPAAKQFLLSAAKAMLPSMEVVTPMVAGGPSKARQRWGAAIKATRTMGNWSFWKSAMTRGLRKRSEEQGAAARADPYKPIYDSIARFIQSPDIVPASLLALVSSNEKTARQRTAAFQGVLSMLRGPAISDFSLAEVLYNVLSSLGGSSYREFTYAINGLLATELRQAYFDLLSLLSKLLGESLGFDAVVLILQLWNMRLRNTDKALVADTRIFHSLVKLLASLTANLAEDKQLRALALSTYMSLGSQLLQQSPGEPRDDALTRGKHAVNVVMARLVQLAALPTLPPGGSSLLCFDLLSLALALIKASDVAVVVVTPESMGAVLRILTASDTVRDQLVAFELATLMLEHYAPAGLDDPLVTLAGRPLVDFAMQLIGAIFVPACPSFFPPATDVLLSSSLQHVGGEVTSAKHVAYAAVVMLRKLQVSTKSKFWSERVLASLNASLAALPALLDGYVLGSALVMAPVTTVETYRALTTTVGALAVLGGLIAPTLAPGSAGRLLASNTEGVVLALSGSSVLFAIGSGTGRTASTYAAADIEAIESTLPSFDNVSISYELIHRFLTLKDSRFVNPELQALYSDLQLRALRIAETILASRPVLAAAFIQANLVPELMRQVLSVGTITNDERRLLCQMIPLIETRAMQTKIRPVCMSLRDGTLELNLASGELSLTHAYAYPPNFAGARNLPVSKDNHVIERTAAFAATAFSAYASGTSVLAGSPVTAAWSGLTVQLDSDDPGAGDELDELCFTVSAFVKTSAVAENAVILAWEGSLPFVFGFARQHADAGGRLVTGVSFTGLSKGAPVLRPVGAANIGEMTSAVFTLVVYMGRSETRVVSYINGEADGAESFTDTVLPDGWRALQPAGHEDGIGLALTGGAAWNGALANVAVYALALDESDIMQVCVAPAMSADDERAKLTVPSTWSDVPTALTPLELARSNIILDATDPLAGAMLLTPFTIGEPTLAALPSSMRARKALTRAHAERYNAMAALAGLAGVAILFGENATDASAIVEMFNSCPVHVTVPVVVLSVSSVAPLIEAMEETEALKGLLEMGPFRVDNAYAALRTTGKDVSAAVDLLMSSQARASGENSLLTALAKDGALDVDQARGRQTNWTGPSTEANVRTESAYGVDNSTLTSVQTAAVPNAFWEVMFDSKIRISSIVIRNLNEGPISRFRDLQVIVYARDEVVYTSPLLNPENMLKNPDTLIVTPESSDGLMGDRVRIVRLPDEDLSGLAAIADRPDRPTSPTDADRFALCFSSCEIYGAPEAGKVKPVAALNSSFELVSYNGGCHAPGYEVMNVIKSSTEPHCSQAGKNFDLVLRYVPVAGFDLATVVIGPATSCTSPLRTCAIWVSEDEPAIGSYAAAYNDWDASKPFPENTPRPAVFIDTNVTRAKSLAGESCSGRYLHIKFIDNSLERTNIDCGPIVLRGSARGAADVVPSTPKPNNAASFAAALDAGMVSAPVEEFRPTVLSDVDSAGASSTYCDTQSDEDLLAMISAASSPLTAKLENALTRLQTSVVPERLVELAALATRKMAAFSRQGVISQLLTNWPHGTPLTLSSLGTIGNLATFVLSFAKNQKPLEYLLVKKRSMLQLDAVVKTVNQLVASAPADQAGEFLRLLLAGCIADHGDDQLMRYAALVVLQTVLLPNASCLSDEHFNKIHDAVLRWIWKATNARYREALFGLLKQLLARLIVSARAPSKRTAQAYDRLRTHLFAKRTGDSPIDPTYVQSLAELLLLFERLKRATDTADGGAGAAGDASAADEAPPHHEPDEEGMVMDAMFADPLPSALVPKSNSVTVSGWSATANAANERCVVASDTPITRLPGLGHNVGYFEARIVCFPAGSPFCGTGLIASSCSTQELVDKTLGLATGTVAMHSDDGALYASSTRKGTGAPYEQGDVIGFGVDFASSLVFFTKNGALLPSTVTDFPLSSPVFAGCTMRAQGMEWEFNFGNDRSARPFRYDIESYRPASAGAPGTGIVSGAAGGAGKTPDWWTKLLLLDACADALVTGDASLFTDAFLEAAYNPVAKTEEVFETTHPYDNNQDLMYEFVCPGVEYLMVRCDTRCRSENNYDYLAFYGDKERTRELKRCTGRDESANWPAEFRLDTDRVYMHFHSDGSNNDWGFRLTVSAPSKELDTNAPKVNVAEMRALYNSAKWSLAIDMELNAMLGVLARKKGLDDPFRAPTTVIREGLTELFAAGGKLPAATVDQLEKRVPILAQFNSLVRDALPLIDLLKAAAVGAPSSVAPGTVLTFSTRMRMLSALVSPDMKAGFLGSMLSRTACTDSYPEIRASRVRANRQLLNFTNQADTLYAQISTALKSKESIRLIRQNERAWKIYFAGEGAIDAGGPYRESITVMAQEFEADCGLFQLVPNGRLGVGQNQGTHVPIPRYQSPEQLEYYRFAGRLLGISIRTKFALPLSLAPFLWKALLGQPLDKSDLRSIDRSTVEALEMVEAADGLDETSFGEVFYETFQTVLSDGTTVELCPGGASKALSYANRAEYARLAIAAHIHAYDVQIAALQDGLASIVPLAVIQGLFTEADLELLVCGEPNLDVDALMAHTVYGDGVSATDRHVVFFWEVLRAMDPEDQARYLKFTWGRSRLPQKGAAFSYQHKIAGFGGPGNPDQALPLSHSCFFTLDLPRYSSAAILRDKLTLAIRECVLIDMDQSDVDRSAFEG